MAYSDLLIITWHTRTMEYILLWWRYLQTMLATKCKMHTHIEHVVIFCLWIYVPLGLQVMKFWAVDCTSCVLITYLNLFSKFYFYFILNFFCSFGWYSFSDNSDQFFVSTQLHGYTGPIIYYALLIIISPSCLWVTENGIRTQIAEWPGHGFNT